MFSGGVVNVADRVPSPRWRQPAYLRVPSPVFKRGVDSVEGRRGRRSVDPANYADQLSLDADSVIELRRVLVIRRLKADAVLLFEETLERYRVLLDLGHDDVAVMRRLLWPDDDVVAVSDVCINHRVAADPQNVSVAIGCDSVRNGEGLARLLVCLDWTAAAISPITGSVRPSNGITFVPLGSEPDVRVVARGVSLIAREWLAPRSSNPSRSSAWR